MKLYPHQENLLKKSLTLNNIALYWEMGLGKTLTVLKLFEQCEKTKKLLVICPLSLIHGAWVPESVKHGFTEPHNLHKSLPLTTEKDIYLVNYEQLLNKQKLAWIQKLLTEHPTLMVLDESSRIKTHNSKTTKQLLRISTLPKRKLILSGTPAPNSPTEYWAQMQFLDDTIFHKRFYTFRNEFFHLQRGKQTIQGRFIPNVSELFKKGFDWSITKENLSKLTQRMKPYVDYKTKKMCLSLPEQINNIYQVTMSPEQKRVYKQLKEDLISEIQEDVCITASSALTKLSKLRQVSSGFVIDTNTRLAHKLAPNAKLRELQRILESDLDHTKPLIIWINYHEEVNMISDLLNKLKRSYVTLYGKTKDKAESINLFTHNKKHTLIANPATAAHGLTFTNCDTMIFYSLSYSYEQYEQAKARTHRGGQKNPCTNIHLIAEKSIDEHILTSLTKKGNTKDLVNSILTK